MVAWEELWIVALALGPERTALKSGLIGRFE
jgi:hypothetical protein